jgi:hypothetical protein
LAGKLHKIDSGFTTNFARNQYQTSIHDNFGGNARSLVLGKQGIKDGVRNLVTDFIGMPFRNRF